MKQLYVVTGAAGHLGNTIIRTLLSEGKSVRGLVLPAELYQLTELWSGFPAGVEYVTGNVLDKTSLEPLFYHDDNTQIYVIHTAGIVDIIAKKSKVMYDVNVKGTKNIVEMCMINKAARLVYVSSVHAIPQKADYRIIEETKDFSAGFVEGRYAKTKAEATKYVLQSVYHGLNAVVVHPSGIIGPYDDGRNHLVKMVKDYINGKLPACVNGGYDFVDVRDVAIGCIRAAEKGGSGECYILSNRHYEVKEVLDILSKISGRRRARVLPTRMVKAVAPIIEWYAKINKTTPLFTSYSLYTLSSNDRFSHEKAGRFLGYQTRDLYDTLKDTVEWLDKKQSRTGKKHHQEKEKQHKLKILGHMG